MSSPEPPTSDHAVSRPVYSKSLAGAAELCMVMPIRQGFAPGLATRSYESRLRSFSKLFSDLRALTRESRLQQPFSDIVDRLRTIHGVTIAIIDGQLLLAVHFDRPWEPYIRLVWDQLGAIFDLILCNCEGYRDHHRSELGFAAFSAWIRRYQVETSTYYLANTRTVSDVIYLEALEARARSGTLSAQALGELKAPTPQERAAAVRAALDGPGYVEYIKTGVQAVTAFHALSELYPRFSDDHDFLLRAARAVLPVAEFPRRRDWQHGETNALRVLGAVFATELAWFEDWQPQAGAPVSDTGADGAPPAAQIQGGILSPYRANVGCTVLLQIRDPARAREWLAAFAADLSWGNDSPDGVFRNLALSFEGLKRLELSAAQLGDFPAAFREGMAARAGLIGDLRSNHPDHWVLPARNYPAPDPAAGPLQAVSLESIDLVVQLRTQVADDERGPSLAAPLAAVLDDLAQATAGIAHILHVQPTYSLGTGDAALEHFGFRDGLSNPDVTSGDSADQEALAPGEIFLGRRNARADAVPEALNQPLLRDGTFLVLRKLAQDVPAFEQALSMNDGLAGHGAQGRERLAAWLMGRERDGTPLAPHSGPNAFDYQDDPTGRRCPLFSHARRLNPRDAGDFIPRVIRRGMSFGPTLAQGPAEAPRGLLFAAYNASLAEQFEVLQRWLSGGNRTAPYSAQSDPITGLPGPEGARRYPLAGGGMLDLGDQPFVHLDWGLYLFVPSRNGLAALVNSPPATTDEQLRQGRALLSTLRATEAADAERARLAWKRALEEKDALDDEQDQALWRVVREDHGGVLRTPFGVLVGDAALLTQVLSEPESFSVAGYRERLADCVGENYLGEDPPEHTVSAARANRVLYAIGEPEAFEVAYRFGSDLLAGMGAISGQATIPMPKYADLLLAEVAQHWFGVPDGETLLQKLNRQRRGGAAPAPPFIVAGGQPAYRDETAHCPFHVISSSRYVFQPQPARAVNERAESDGKRLRQGVERYATALLATPGALADQPILAQLHQCLAQDGRDDEFAAVILGALLGFMPTASGNFFFTMRQWVRDKDLWRVQNDYLQARQSGATSAAAAFDRLRPALARGIARRPIPAMIHRRAAHDLRLGGESIKAGELVVCGLVSAAAQSGYTDMSPAFGGDFGATPLPTHACPGQKLGVGTLLGMIAALFDAPGSLRRAPADGALLFDPVAPGT
ncbi:MAG: hypothetical protein AAGI15_01260 [Pseudomonadota bacterium]